MLLNRIPLRLGQSIFAPRKIPGLQTMGISKSWLSRLLSSLDMLGLTMTSDFWTLILCPDWFNKLPRTIWNTTNALSWIQATQNNHPLRIVRLEGVLTECNPFTNILAFHVGKRSRRIPHEGEKKSFCCLLKRMEREAKDTLHNLGNPHVITNPWRWEHDVESPNQTLW